MKVDKNGEGIVKAVVFEELGKKHPLRSEQVFAYTEFQQCPLMLCW